MFLGGSHAIEEPHYESAYVYKNDSDVYPYTIHSTTAGARPYMKEQLFSYTNIAPYNNITSDDSISVAWALEELKSYISELRYLTGGLIGYTNNDNISTYILDNSGLYKIDNNRYILTSQQIQALQPTPDDEYTHAVYCIGLQSDWTNNIKNSFGYIHNRPQIINATAIYNLWRSTSADSVIG